MANEHPDEISRKAALEHFMNARKDELKVALQRFVLAAARAEQAHRPSAEQQEQFNDNLEEWIVSMAGSVINEHGKL